MCKGEKNLFKLVHDWNIKEVPKDAIYYKDHIKKTVSLTKIVTATANRKIYKKSAKGE